ncbi:uncharacterized protein LOC116674201 isoform X4 [Etheostoma spectabile]|uniref:uncharacterized protein LOC116674201 isoform X3 n=1 Tax=Etheostoma spectabile TaxID=54343 RepID=UPI0013AF021B|nr:uncharacterized protein LOC116674201 isoform X3 [Etheostoma spectabile]XP_032362646.1 uncharacterized protein LOC116674201 isoform X4 [Etheostoma spectabile]
MESHVHNSVLQKNNIPQLTRCTVCCTKYHCPLCPPSMYKARNRAKVLQHMEVHVNNAIRHEDFFITKCHQACRSGSSGHFHCPFCCKTTIKRQDTLRHLQICRPPRHDAQLDADADLSQKDITSQTEECKGSVNLPHLSNDKLPVSVLDSEMPGPGDPAETAQDPSPESVLLFNSRVKPPTMLCPHCNVQLQRKNLKKHLYRKHSVKAEGNIAANSHAEVDGRNEKDAVKKSILGPLDLQKETCGKGPQIQCESSECQVSELGIAAAWSLLSHACAPPTVHDSEMQEPGDPAEGPQDPSPESVLLSSPPLDNPPCREPRANPPHILCPHCNVQLLRKNLKMHIYRKHPDKAVEDIAANPDLDAVCIDERNGESKRKPGAKRTKSCASPVSANRPGRKRKARKLN